MLFDELCRLAERGDWTDLKTNLRRARIFRMETGVDRGHENKALGSWAEDEQLVENLKLPFDCIAIEHADKREARGDACVMFWRGLGGPRTFGFAAIAQETDASVKHVVAIGSMRAFPDGTFDFNDPVNTNAKWAELENVRWGWVDRNGIDWAKESIVDFRALTAKPLGVTHTEVWGPLPEIEDDDVARRAEEMIVNHEGFGQRALDGERAKEFFAANGGQPAYERVRRRLAQRLDQYERIVWRMNAAIAWMQTCRALAMLVVINTPSSFVVEENPRHAAPTRPGMIPRSPTRPHYIVLTPTEIRRRLNLPDVAHADGDGPKRRAHERRGHWRTYTSERYSRARGQRQWIDACWIGPREADVGQNRYTVRLDL